MHFTLGPQIPGDGPGWTRPPRLENQSYLLFNRKKKTKLTYSWAGRRSAVRVQDVMLEVSITNRTGAFHRPCQWDVCCMRVCVLASLVMLCTHVFQATTYGKSAFRSLTCMVKCFKRNEHFLSYTQTQILISTTPNPKYSIRELNTTPTYIWTRGSVQIRQETITNHYM